jgi:hypothetical protein
LAEQLSTRLGEGLSLASVNALLASVGGHGVRRYPASVEHTD